jgi:hypothetical protein
MKKITTLVFILFSIPFYAQWFQQNSGTTEFLNDIYCINENVVVTVGENGIILKTIDGGINWVQKASGTNYLLNKVQFANANVGYVIGYNNTNGILLKTTDGGENWSLVDAAGTSFIYDISMVDENIIYLTNLDGILKKTINGGNSFETVNTNTFLERIQFINEQTGYGSSFSLNKTIDGGVTWTEICPIDYYPANGAFFFVNEQVGFVNTITSLTRTTDGGQNFTYLDTVDYNMFKLFAPTENIVWGVTWQSWFNSPPDRTMRGEVSIEGEFQRIDSDTLFKSIHFANETIGFGVSNEKIYKNITGTILGANNVYDKSVLKIYPNPALNQITVSFTENQTNAFSIKIADNLGKEMYSENYTARNSVTINMESFSKGFYFLTIISQEKKQTQKIIIK